MSGEVILGPNSLSGLTLFLVSLAWSDLEARMLDPRILGLILTGANCIMWDNIFGQDVYLKCTSRSLLTHGRIRVPTCK